MLKSVSKFLIAFFLLSSCSQQHNKNASELLYNKIHAKSVEILGVDGYNNLHAQMSDSLKMWMKADLRGFTSLKYKEFIDSLYCINSAQDKIIGIQLGFNGFQEKTQTDGFEEFYGAKIKGKWYFWTGGYTPVERKGLKGHDPRNPLSYKQVHRVAVSSLGGYLDANGNIRDEWFEARFSGDGWCSFKDRYIYKSILDGQKIDNEKDFWNYIWKKKGLGLWIRKISNDSITKHEFAIGRKLSTEEKNEIYMKISSKMVLEN